MLLPIAGLASLSVAIGLLAGPLTDLSLETAGQLLDPSVYVTAVLGSASGP
jgi:multicomponent Na+:H+ antiporter subunit D